MRTRYFTWLLLSSLVITLAIAGQAASQGDVTAQLAIFKVLSKPDGKDVLEPTEQVKPGDVVEYQATYRNQGKQLVKAIMATLPIPEGMTYQPHTAAPAAVSASVDGKTFEPVPLRREVRLPDGRTEKRDVPYSEYRFLRWELDQIAAGKEKTVQARVQVNPAGAPETQAGGENTNK